MPSLSSLCLSDCPPSCAVLGADLHRKCSRGRDGRQGLHHCLWRPRGHGRAVPRQVREPHQQIRERNGRRSPPSYPACPLPVLLSLWGVGLKGASSSCLGTLRDVMHPYVGICPPRSLLPFSQPTQGPACGVGVGLEQARGHLSPRLLAVRNWVVFKESSSPQWVMSVEW